MNVFTDSAYYLNIVIHPSILFDNFLQIIHENKRVIKFAIIPLEWELMGRKLYIK